MSFFESLKMRYLNYSFAIQKDDLSNRVIEICNILNKGFIVAEVFSKDSLNDILLLNSCFISQNKNFNYYICDQINFFQLIDFVNARHFVIYSIEELPQQPINIKYLNDNFTFFICFENYLNTNHLKVCRKYYPDSIKNCLNNHKYITRCFWG